MSKKQRLKRGQLAGIIAVPLILIGTLGVWWLSNLQANRAQDQQFAAATDAEKFAAEYPNTAADSRYVYATNDEVLEAFATGDGVVFLGFPECPWCQQLAPIVDEAAEAEGVDKVLYLNIRTARADNDDVYQQLVEALRDHLSTDEDGNPRITVPDVTALKGGEIVGRFEQEPATDGERVTPDTYWTAERRERAVEQLREMMRRVQDIPGVEASE